MSTFKKVIGILILIAVVGTATYFIQSKYKTDDTSIQIGAILPLSGQNAYYGEEIRNAITLAQEEINKNGGINNKTLSVIFEDDQADPKLGATAMQKLVNVDKVPVVLGPWASGSVLASAPIAEKSKTIIMAEALAPKISNAGDYIFRIQPSATYYSAKLMEVAVKKLHLKNVAIIYANNEFGVALRDTVGQELDRLGGHIIAREAYTQGDQDFRSQITKIKQFHPEALFIGGYQEQAFIIRQANELGLKTVFLAGPTFENKKLVESLGPLAEGVIYGYHFVAESDNPKTISYEKSYRARFGIDTGGYAPLMYDGTYIIADALKQCSMNTDCIKTKLYSTVYDGVSGHIVFDSNGDAMLPVVVKSVKHGQFVKYEE